MVEAYCVKCKKKGQKMKDAVMTQTAKVDLWLKENVLIAELLCVL
jgi:hypothetical protein